MLRTRPAQLQQQRQTRRNRPKQIAAPRPTPPPDRAAPPRLSGPAHPRPPLQPAVQRAAPCLPTTHCPPMLRTRQLQEPHTLKWLQGPRGLLQPPAAPAATSSASPQRRLRNRAGQLQALRLHVRPAPLRPGARQPAGWLLVQAPPGRRGAAREALPVSARSGARSRPCVPRGCRSPAAPRPRQATAEAPLGAIRCRYGETRATAQAGPPVTSNVLSQGLLHARSLSVRRVRHRQPTPAPAGVKLLPRHC
mmetsp:Transcript_11794/g.46032  ORF Transcript_11794/g.46032 Transcript_11794/m.46032 type:complete len:250 (+) Transcript_11794:103-852(+)